MSEHFITAQDGRCVLFDELDEIAAWCRGEIGVSTEPGKEPQHYILVDADKHYDVPEHRAYVGCWIMPAIGDSFVVWSDEFYRSRFAAASKNRDKFTQVLHVVQAAMADGASNLLKNGNSQGIIAESATLRIMEILEN